MYYTNKTVLEFLEKCKTYYLATVEDGEPRVRPFGTIDLYDGGLYIQTGRVKDVSKQLAANPAFELCAFNGSEWIRINGRLVEDDRQSAREHMLEKYPDLKAIYKPDDGNTQVFRMENARAVIYSFNSIPIEIMV